MRFVTWMLAGASIGTAMIFPLLWIGLPEVVAGLIGTAASIIISIKGWP